MEILNSYFNKGTLIQIHQSTVTMFEQESICMIQPLVTLLGGRGVFRAFEKPVGSCGLVGATYMMVVAWVIKEKV